MGSERLKIEPIPILIAGKKGSGKDFCSIITRRYLESKGYTCKINSFANPIKDMMCTLLRIDHKQLDLMKNDSCHGVVKVSGDGFEQTSSMRSILQTFGTDIMQTYFGKHVWRDMLIKDITESDCDFYIVPDFRFVSEIVPNSITILINSRDKDEHETIDNHISENDLNDFIFDYKISNIKKDCSVNKEIELVIDDILALDIKNLKD